MGNINNKFADKPSEFILQIYDDHLSHSYYKISIAMTKDGFFDYSLSSGAEAEYDEWESEQHLFINTNNLHTLYDILIQKNNINDLSMIIEKHINKVFNAWATPYKELFAIIMEYYSNDQAFLKFKLILESNKIKYSETNEFEEYLN